jgi:hypothetical protein
MNQRDRALNEHDEKRKLMGKDRNETVRQMQLSKVVR